MSCLDLLRQQACDLRKESDAASQKYKKSVDRGFAATVEEGWELLSQVRMSKRMRMQRRYSMMYSGNPLSSRVTGASMTMHSGEATGFQFAGTPYQRPTGSTHTFRTPRPPTTVQPQPQMPQYQPPQRQTFPNRRAQWTSGYAGPHLLNDPQPNVIGQLPTPQVPTSEPHSHHPASQQSPMMQRQMPSQQQHLAGNGHGHWMNANATPNRMDLQRGQAMQQHHRTPTSGAQFVANSQVQPAAQHHLTDPKCITTRSGASTGQHSSAFHTPTTTPVGMRKQNQYAPGSVGSQRFAAGNSSVQQNNAHYAQQSLTHQLHGVDSTSKFSSAGVHSPAMASGAAALVPTMNSSQYPTVAVSHMVMHQVGGFSGPTSTATGQHDVLQNNAYVAQPQHQGLDANNFFSLSEQELDEVLALLADSNTMSQQETPMTNASMPTTAVTTAGARAIHVSVPAGAEVLEVRESSVHPDAHDVVTTAGTFTAFGQASSANQQPQRQRHLQIAP